MAGCAKCRERAARAAVAEPAPDAPIVRLDLFARQYMGVPFLHQGRNPKVGIDCIGLLRLCVDDSGAQLSHHDRTDYDRNPAHGALERQLQAAFGAPVCCLQPGCVVSIDFKGETRHVGVIAENGGALTLIHTSSSVGRVVERRMTPAYRKNITGIYRLEVAA